MKNDLTFEEKTKLFMEVMNQSEEFNSNDPLRFCDIVPTISSNTKVYRWFYLQLYNNLDGLLLECQKYKDMYPIAYQRVISKIQKRQNSLSREKKIELLMAYLEHHNIPTGRDNLRFCDMNNEIQDTTVVGIFIQTNLGYKESIFWKECSRYQSIYPIAFQKMKMKIEKRHNLNVQKERIRIYMKYIDEFSTTSYQDRIRFCDIEEQCVDTVLMDTWIRFQLSKNMDWLKKEYVKYKEIYPNAYYRINSRIMALENKRKENLLDFTKRVALLLYYLEKQENLQIDKTLTFQDIGLGISDSTLVRSWLSNQLSTNGDSLLKEAIQYKEVYPVGYQKLLLREEKCRKESSKISNYLSFSERMELFMNYIECNIDVFGRLDIKFSDIDSNTKDESSVKNWFRKNLSFNLSKFIQEYSKYREKCPNAYQKVTERINHSKVRLTKPRELQIEELKYLRDSLVEEKSLGKVREYKK